MEVILFITAILLNLFIACSFGLGYGMRRFLSGVLRPRASMHLTIIRADGKREDGGFANARLPLAAIPRVAWVSLLMRAHRTLTRFQRWLERRG